MLSIKELFDENYLKNITVFDVIKIKKFCKTILK